MHTDYAKGDDRPIIRDQLTRGRATIPLGPNDTVQLYVEDPEGEIFINDVATIEDRPESEVKYEMDGGWPLAGTYEAEWVINYSDGGTQTVPNGSPKEIHVREILDRQADVREYDDPNLSLENLQVDSIGANTASGVTVGSPLDVDSVLRAHGVKNLDNLIVGFWGGEPGLSARGMHVFQMGDDSAAVGDAGYATGAHFLTEAGERIATMAADKAHNHWGIYTRGRPFDGTDAQPVKRFNIAGGSPVTKADYYKVDQYHIGPRTEDGSHDGNMDFIIEAESDGNINLRLDHDGSPVANIMYDSGRRSVRLQNSNAATTDFLELRENGDIRAHGHDITEAGTVNADSVSADEITVGGTGPVTGIMGDSGDWWPLWVQRESGDHKTTSTSYTNTLGFDGRIRVDFDSLASLSGFDAIGFGYSASWAVPDGETADTELFVFSGGSRETITSKSVSGPASYPEFSSSIGPYSGSGDINLEIRRKSQGGKEIDLRTPTITAYGRIK
ncbi:hypothetical protein [Haloterrigena salifodinae]|uniref:hypothetical protein n=1 Tax=Haloterrigena salifodinae TaxID=2675099 RepID=UPI000F86F1CD|nr:hypothetical protein [Haloterrigena salifodinae]